MATAGGLPEVRHEPSRSARTTVPPATGLVSRRPPPRACRGDGRRPARSRTAGPATSQHRRCPGPDQGRTSDQDSSWPPEGLDAGWHDTLAVASIVIPTLLFIYFAIWLWIWASDLSIFVVLLFIALPPALALLRYRRAAILICLVPLLFSSFLGAQYIGHITWISGQVAGLFLAFLLTTLAIVFSPGPARGLQIMNAKSWTVVCMVGLGVIVREPVVGRLYLQPGIEPSPGWWIIPLGAAVVAAALGLIYTLPSPVGKRLLILLAIPAYPSLVSIAAGEYAATAQHEVIYLPTLAIVGLAAARAWRSRRRSHS